jgi:hypothetical protein
MSFRIAGLPLLPFAPLFELSDQQLLERDAVRMTVDASHGFPCRVSLRDAAVGESVILLNYEHLPVASPYRSSHAIFVREAAQEASLAVNEVPDMLAIRLLSIRGFDPRGMMCTADVVPGSAAAATIERMLSDPAVEYLHIHNAKPGCYAARVERAP